MLGNKIDTKIYMKKSPPICRSKQPRGNRPTINREYKLQGWPIFIGVQEIIFQGIFQIYRRN
jgi:hypothetical protein